MNRAVVALRYTRARSGTQFTLPARFASHDDDVVIMVGRSERKMWWRNFRSCRDIEVLRAGQWVHMTWNVVARAAEPEPTRVVAQIYQQRFRRSGTARRTELDDKRLRRVAMVRCRPRQG